MDQIQTERLLLRRWLEADLEPFAALNADPEVMRNFPAPLGRTASDAFVADIERRFEEQGYGLWAVEQRSSNEFLGFTGLNPMPDYTPAAGGMEVGWRLARRAWGHGFATEAAGAALRVARDAGWPEIWSMTAVVNTRSIAVMRRLGLVEHSRFDYLRVPVGHPLRPSVLYHRTLHDIVDPAVHWP